jgi:hypothetical protein
MTPAATRQRRHRDRARDGVVCLTVEVPELDLVEALVAARLLDPEDTDNRGKLREVRQSSRSSGCWRAVTDRPYRFALDWPPPLDETGVAMKSLSEIAALDRGVRAGEFSSFVRCWATARGVPHKALAIAEKSRAPSRTISCLKAAVAGGGPSDPSWGSAFVDWRTLSTAFVDSLI